MEKSTLEYLLRQLKAELEKKGLTQEYRDSLLAISSTTQFALEKFF